MFISTKKPNYKLNISTAVLHMKCRDPYFFTVFFVGMWIMMSCFCGKRRLPLFPSGPLPEIPIIARHEQDLNVHSVQ